MNATISLIESNLRLGDADLKRFLAAHNFAQTLAGENDRDYVRYFWAAYDIPAQFDQSNIKNLLLNDSSLKSNLSNIEEKPDSELPSSSNETLYLSHFAREPEFARGERQRISLALNRVSIVGGDPAIDQFRDCVAVGILGTQGPNFHCSGVVVGLKTVLTAAHCVKAGGSYGVFTGFDIHQGATGSLIGAKGFHLVSGADLALLFFEDSLGINFLSLDSSGLGDVGQIGYMAGYGFNDVDAQSGFGVRRQGMVTVAANSDASQIVVGPNSASHAPVNGCFGDSGGPLYLHDGTQWRIAGIYHGLFGATCQGGSIFTRVSAFLDDIKKIPGADIP